MRVLILLTALAVAVAPSSISTSFAKSIHQGPPMQQRDKDEEIATDTSAMVSRYKSMMSKVNSRNIVSTMSNYSTEFYNEGTDYYGAACSFAIAFVTPRYSLKLSNFRVTYAAVQLPFGYLEGLLHVKETQDGTVITDQDILIGMYFAKYGSTWLLYGDQSDPSAQASSLSERLRRAVSSAKRN